MDAIVHIGVWLICVALAFGLLLYLLNISPIPEPFKGWIWFVLVGLAVLLIIYFLLNLAGPMPSLALRH